MGSKLVPVTPVPDHVPPAGFPTNNAEGSPGQKGPIRLLVKSKTKTSRSIGNPGQLAAFDSTTSIALRYKPETAPQSTVIKFVVCPVCITLPPPVTVQLYVDVGVFVTKYCHPLH